MDKFKGLLFCTDLDGTLLPTDGHEVSKGNMDAIRYFQAEGGLFTFVTGRMPFFAKEIYEMIQPNAPFGCINGGGIYDHRAQSYAWTQTLSHKAVKLVDYAVQNVPGIGVQLNTFDKVYFCRENSAMERFRRITGMPNRTANYFDVTDPIAKIVFGDEDEEHINAVRDLLNAHPMAKDFDFVRSELTLYEILPKGISKGTVLAKLAELLGVDPRRTIAVGDYNNDVSMIRAAGLGIAVANACEEAKQAAKHITVSNDEDAIAKIIEDLDCGRLVV